MNKLIKIGYHLLSLFSILGIWVWRQYGRASIDPKRVIYVTFLGIKHDGRVRKSVDALLAGGYEVELVKPSDAWDDEVQSWHPRLTITSLGFSGSYVYFPYVLDWKVLRHLMRSPASEIYCRDIFTGVMGVLAARQTGKKSIIDFFEWYSAAKDYDGIRLCLKDRPAWKNALYRVYERFCCRYGDVLITNNLSFARGIAQRVVPAEQFVIIRNVPDHFEIDPDPKYNLRQFLPLDQQNNLLLYYVGQMPFNRRFDFLIQCMRFLPQASLILQGTGHDRMKASLQKELERSGAQERIHFLPPVPSKELIYYTATADIGVLICDMKDEKHYYTLPNKIFEYIIAEIPQLSVSRPECDALIRKEGVGAIFEIDNPKSFCDALENVQKNYREMEERVRSYKRILSTENDFALFSGGVTSLLNKERV